MQRKTAVTQQTILDKDASLAERDQTLFYGYSNSIDTYRSFYDRDHVDIEGVFRGRGGTAATTTSPPKDEGASKTWLKGLANALKRLAGRAVEASSAIVGSVFQSFLSFFANLLDLQLNIHRLWLFLLQGLLDYG